MTASLAASLETVREQIARAAERGGRRAEDVVLVAVSKGVPTAAIREAMALGQLDFGENRVQEAAVKYKEIGEEARWHFVGRLQRNKIRRLVAFASVIHSLDRAELAEELSKRAHRATEVLVEVNTSEEPAKGGVLPASLPGLLEEVADLERLRITGLMTMAPRVADKEEARPCFRRLAVLGEMMRQRFPELPLAHLSMGMSQDYEVAVEEGATMVRIGEAIFGPRSPASDPDLGGTIVG